MPPKVISLLILIALLSACDCHFRSSGLVVDSSTNMPIDQVLIQEESKLESMGNYTNREGFFELSTIAGNCHTISYTFSKEGYLNQSIKLQNNSFDTLFLEPVASKVSFDPSQDFNLKLIESSNKYPSSETDTSICKGWNLESDQIKTLMKASRKISGSEWHHLFGHYPCVISAELSQKEQKFELTVNAGAWFSLSSVDTTIYYGYFENDAETYFLDSAWEEEDF